MSSHQHSGAEPPAASTLLPRSDVAPDPGIARKRLQPGSFTKASIIKMNCPSGRTEKFFWDASCSGFGIRALNSGRRSWIYQYRDDHGQTRRMVLGDVTSVSLDAARNSARQKAAGVAQGGNPSSERRKQRAAGTILEAIEIYLTHAKERQKARSYKETQRHLRIHATPLHHERADTVNRATVAALLARVAKGSGPIAANRLRAALSAFWTWGLRTGWIETDGNPITFTIRQPEKSRERILSDFELKAIWASTEDTETYSRVVRLVLLTGCRREEIGGLRWDEIDGNRILIGADRMKGKLGHEIALLPMILSNLPSRPVGAEGNIFGRGGTGFSGWSKSKAKLDARLKHIGNNLQNWGLHDFRRTFSTRLHDAGIEPLVIEALLAHKQQGVAAVYNRASFREAKRIALTRWHEIVRAVTSADSTESTRSEL
jgi:integrase